MKNMNKVLSLVLAVALVIVVSVGATVAYLTDRDSKANIFTIGDVDIVLNGSHEQGATLTPGVDIYDNPTITNIGKNDAWVWATIAIPAVLDSEYAYNNVVHFNYDKESVADGLWTWKTEDGTAWNMKAATINGMDYNVYTVMYQSPLEVGAETESVMTKVYMDTRVDITPDGEMYIVEAGNPTKVGWNVQEDAFPVIYVSAYAVQVEGFHSVWDAHDAYFGQWGDNGYIWAEPGIPVTNEEELLKAFEVGGPYILEADIELDSLATTTISADMTLNLNGHTISAKRNHPPEGAEQSWAVLDVRGAEVTFKGEGSIVNTGATGAYGIAVYEGAHVIIDGPTVESYHDAVYVANGTLTVLNGVLNATEDNDGTMEDGALTSCVDCNRATAINCSDSGLTNGLVKVVIKGGTFINYNPSSVHEGWAHQQNFVAEGYKVTAQPQANGDIWYVVEAE